jgi:hypothetical protein
MLSAAHGFDTGMPCCTPQDTLAELGLLEFVPYLARQLCPAKQAGPCPSQAAGMYLQAFLQQLALLAAAIIASHSGAPSGLSSMFNLLDKPLPWPATATFKLTNRPFLLLHHV